MDTLDRFGWKYSRDAAVERCAHGINIGPGTHVSVIGVLLDRGKTMLEDYGNALVFGISGTRGTEIEEL